MFLFQRNLAVRFKPLLSHSTKKKEKKAQIGKLATENMPMTGHTNTRCIPASGLKRSHLTESEKCWTHKHATHLTANIQCVQQVLLQVKPV